MAKIKVKIIDKDTLQLEEDGKVGDQISLSDSMSIDTGFIESLINNAKEEAFKSRIEQINKANKAELENALLSKENELKKGFEDEKKVLQDRYNELDKNYTTLMQNHELQLKNIEIEINAKNTDDINILTTKHTAEINKKDSEILALQKSLEAEKTQRQLLVETEKSKIENSYKDEINELKRSIENLQKDISNNEQNYKTKTELSLLEQQQKLTADFEEEKKKLIEEKNNFESKYQQLSLIKSSLNVKKLGEELERTCDEEYKAAAMYGFENCEWFKDNTAIKENEDDAKGTKADFIFKVYSSEERIKENLLTSVCLEMKNESNVSEHKKKNSDHYDKLDKDRKKKECEYALLVSELEWQTNNDSPIKKVDGYPKMYVVRPQYMITFLSIIYSLAQKYKELLNESNKEALEFQESQKILDDFEDFKTKYLEKPLASFEKTLTEVNGSNDKIISLALDNQNKLTQLITTQLSNIKDKIERFDIKKIAKNIDKLDK